ncbi:MAG: protein-disulfide reductase DsbD domain-containing protein [Saprospiraceae bacterium]
MCKLLCNTIFILLFSFSFMSDSFAQLDPVKWTFEVEQVNDGEYDLIITADIERGWSVYSQHLESQSGPIPTSFHFDENSGIQLVGTTQEVGNNRESYDTTFGVKIVKFSRKAKFTQRVIVADATEIVKGKLTYMTCDATSCLPPADVDFTIALNH